MWLVRRNERHFTVFSFRAGCSTKYHTACRRQSAYLHARRASSHPEVSLSIFCRALRLRRLFAFRPLVHESLVVHSAAAHPAGGDSVSDSAQIRYAQYHRHRADSSHMPMVFHSHMPMVFIVTCRIHSHMPQRVAEPRPKLRRPKLRVHTCVWLPRFPDGGCRGAPSCLPTCRPQPAACAAVRARRGLLRASQRAA